MNHFLSAGAFPPSSGRNNINSNSVKSNFNNFSGKYVGSWHQHKSNNSEESSDWYADWSRVNIEERFYHQPVVIRKKIKQLEFETGMDGINSYDTQSGVILGNVCASKNQDRPHLGYFVDENTLIWLAKEPDGNYGLFYETKINGVYRVRGLYFGVDANSNNLTFCHPNWGDYKAPTKDDAVPPNLNSPKKPTAGSVFPII